MIEVVGEFVFGNKSNVEVEQNSCEIFFNVSKCCLQMNG